MAHTVTGSTDILMDVSQQHIAKWQRIHQLLDACHVSFAHTWTHKELLLESGRTEHVQLLWQRASHTRRDALDQRSKQQSQHCLLDKSDIQYQTTNTNCWWPDVLNNQNCTMKLYRYCWNDLFISQIAFLTPNLRCQATRQSSTSQ